MRTGPETGGVDGGFGDVAVGINVVGILCY